MLFRGLGPVAVEVDGVERDLGSRLQRRLLCVLLARRPEVVTADQLVETVWPVSAPAAASTSLQSYVSHLRRALEPDRARRTAASAIVSVGNGYRLAVDDSDTDIGRFEAGVATGIRLLADGDAPAAAASFDGALELWRGEPYADLGDADVAVFPRSRLTELFEVASEQRAAAQLVLGRVDEATASLEALVRAQPLRERRWELLITALYRAGRQADALRAYQRARETLVEELGIEPGPALRRLELQVIEQDPALLAPAPAPRADGATAPDAGTAVVPVPLPEGLPLVGRETSLAQLRADREVALAGQLRVSLVAGEAGIGKSRLTEAIAAEVERQADPVWWSFCRDTPGSPALWPWMQVARQLVAAAPSALSTLAALLPGFAAGSPSGSAGPEAHSDLAAVRFRLFDALVAELATAAKRRPLTIVIEDLHWADPATLDMLGFLVESRVRAPLHLVVTRRSDEASTDALRELLARLARSTNVSRVTLTGLAPDEVAQFSRDVAGRELTSREAHELHARTSGNPFFLTELTRWGASAGLAGDDVPDGVRDVVVGRLELADPGLTALLKMAAVAGERFRPEVVAAAAGIDAATSASLYSLGQRTHWLAPTADGVELRFTHALVRDVLLAEQAALERRAAHWAIGLATSERRGEDSTALSEIARHLAAGVPVGDVRSAQIALDAARRGAEWATRRQAHDEAADNLRLAESLMASAGMAGEPAVRLHLALGESLRLAGDWALAREAFSRGFSDALALDDPRLVAEAAVSFRTMWLWTWREHGVTDHRMVDALRRCLTRLEPDPRLETLVHCTLGVELFYLDRDAAVEHCRRALEIARTTDDDAVLLESLRALYLTLKSPEHHEERIEVATMLVDAAGRVGNLDLEAHARINQSFLMLQSCSPAAWTEHQRARAMTEQLHEPMKIAYVRQHAAVWAYLHGDVAEAERLAELAHEVHGRSGFWNTRAVHEIALVQFHHQRGTLAEHLKHHPAVSPDGSSPMTQPIIDIACAYAAHLIGDDDTAHRLLASVPQPRPGSSWLANKFMHAVTAAAIDAPGVDLLYEQLEPFAGRLAIGSEGPAVFGVIDHALGALAARQGNRSLAERWFRRALDRYEALGDGPPAALTRSALAALGVA